MRRKNNSKSNQLRKFSKTWAIAGKGSLYQTYNFSDQEKELRKKGRQRMEKRMQSDDENTTENGESKKKGKQKPGN
jgi:hypothetical protein